MLYLLYINLYINVLGRTSFAQKGFPFIDAGSYDREDANFFDSPAERMGSRLRIISFLAGKRAS